MDMTLTGTANLTLLSLCLWLTLTAPSAGQNQPAVSQSFGIEFRSDSESLFVDSEIAIGVWAADTTPALGGFNLLIEYDFGALVFDSATLGELTRSQWEFFDVNSGLLNPDDEDDLRAFVRLVAIADSHGDPAHPSERSLVGPGEFATLFFYVGEDLAGDSTRLQFVWQGCGDNSFSDQSGNKLMVAKAAPAGVRDTLSYEGPAVECFDSVRNPPQQIVNFHNFWLRPQPQPVVLPDSS